MLGDQLYPDEGAFDGFDPRRKTVLMSACATRSLRVAAKSLFRRYAQAMAARRGRPRICTNAAGGRMPKAAGGHGVFQRIRRTGLVTLSALGRRYLCTMCEPPRDSRRLFRVSQAARA